MTIEIKQDAESAILVMHEVGRWMESRGMNPSKWWKPENLNKKFLFKYAKPNEFYVAMVDGEPAAAAVFQVEQAAQDWTSVDRDSKVSALYIHWLCAGRKFASKGLPKMLVDFAKQLAGERDIKLLRADTNAKEKKLRAMYEKLGFTLKAEVDEGYRSTAFYEISLEK